MMGDDGTVIESVSPVPASHRTRGRRRTVAGRNPWRTPRCTAVKSPLQGHGGEGLPHRQGLDALLQDDAVNALQPEAELRGAGMGGSADSAADVAAEERLEVTRRLMRAALAGDAVELASAIGQAERAGLMDEAAMARAKLDKLQPAQARAQQGAAPQRARPRTKGADSRGKKPTQARNPTRVPGAESRAPQAAQSGSRESNGAKGSVEAHRKSPVVPAVGASNSDTHRPVAAWLEKRGKGRFTAAVCTLFGQTDENPTEWVDTLGRMERSGLVDGLLAALESDGQVDSGGGGKRVYAPNDVRNKKKDAAGEQTEQQGGQPESKRNQPGSNRNQPMCEQKQLAGDKRKASLATAKLSIEKQRQRQAEQRQAEHAVSTSKGGGERAKAMRHARPSEDKGVGRNCFRDTKDSQHRARASRGGSMPEPEPEPDPPAGKLRGAQTQAQAQQEVAGEVPTRNDKTIHSKKSAARKQPTRSTDSSCEVSSAADGELHTSTVSIHVSNISYDTSELALRNAFSQFGALKHVAHFDNKHTSRSGRRPGYAFIEFSSAASAQAAINASLDLSITLDDRELKVRRVKSERKSSGDKSIDNNHRTQRQRQQPQQGTLSKTSSRASTSSTRVGPQRPLSPQQRIPREVTRAKSQGRSRRAKSTPRGVSTRVESNAYPSSASAATQRHHQGQQRVYAPNDVRNITNRTSQAVQRQQGSEGDPRVGQTSGSPERSTRASARAKSASRNIRNSQQRQRSDTNTRRTDQGVASPHPSSTPRSTSPPTRGRSAAAVRSRSTPRQGRWQCDASTDSTAGPETVNRVFSNASARVDVAGVDRAGAVRNIGASHSSAADHEQRLEATQMMRTAALSGDKVSLKAAIAWAEASPIRKSLEGDLAIAALKLQKMG